MTMGDMQLVEWIVLVSTEHSDYWDTIRHQNKCSICKSVFLDVFVMMEANSEPDWPVNVTFAAIFSHTDKTSSIQH